MTVKASRIKAIARLVLAQAAVYVRRRWTISVMPPILVRFCPLADDDHARTWRHFAHSGHGKDMVCLARAAEHELTDREIAGIIAHELGHIFAMRARLPAHMREPKKRYLVTTPKLVQDEADDVAREVFGFEIRYNRRTLEELAPVWWLRSRSARISSQTRHLKPRRIRSSSRRRSW